jgi:hypothetical protein
MSWIRNTDSKIINIVAARGISSGQGVVLSTTVKSTKNLKIGATDKPNRHECGRNGAPVPEYEHTDKKENQILLIYGEIQSGPVAKSYMTNGLLIYREIFAHFLIF